MNDPRIDEVLRFWFDVLVPDQWFEKDELLDRAIADRFLDLHSELSARVPPRWCQDANGCLAAILVLDQFSRNIYRSDPRAFASDKSARVLAGKAVEEGWDNEVDSNRRPFFYLPFTHAEDPADQAVSVELHSSVGGKFRHWAVLHKDIIDRFGRYPQRNAALGRVSTEQERDFLRGKHTSF